MPNPPTINNSLDRENRRYVVYSHAGAILEFKTVELAFLYYASKHHGLSSRRVLDAYRSWKESPEPALSEA